MNPGNVRLTILFQLILLFSAISFAQDFVKKNLSKTSSNDFNQKIDINNIEMWVSNDGIHANDPSRGGSGFYWPKNSPNSALYSDGFALVGKVKLLNGTTELRAIGGLYRAGLQAGKILNSGTFQNNIYISPVADEPLKSENRVYKIQKNWELLPDSDPNKVSLQKDYVEWPKDQGAPVDNNGKPLFLGDQTLYYVSNDLSSTRTNLSFGSNPIGLEMQTTIWAYKSFAFEDVIFVQRKFINKSGLQLDSMYFSIYSDPDIGNAGDDLSGCDSLLELIFGYHYGLQPDAEYGYQAPSFGYIFLETPLKPNSAIGDTAVIGGIKVTGKANIGMTAVFGLLKSWDDINDLPIANSNAARYAFNYSQAMTQSGKQQLNNLGQPVKFAFGGNPITGQGDVFYKHFKGGDIRLFGTTGPFKFQPGDTQTIVYALLIAKGLSNVGGVDELKQLAKSVKSFYPEMILLPDSIKIQTTVSNTGKQKLIGSFYYPSIASPQNVFIEFIPTNMQESSFSISLKQSGIPEIWTIDTLIDFKKYPHRFKIHVITDNKDKIFNKWSTFLTLRPVPEVEKIEIIDETGIQDKELNPGEKVALQLTLRNVDPVNSIDIMKVDWAPDKIFSFPPNDKMLINELKILSVDPWDEKRYTLGFYLTFDENTRFYSRNMNLTYRLKDSTENVPFLSINSETNDFTVSIADQTLLTGKNYKIDFQKVDHEIRWRLTNISEDHTVADSLKFQNYFSDINYFTGSPIFNSGQFIFDGLLINTKSVSYGSNRYWDFSPNSYISWVGKNNSLGYDQNNAIVLVKSKTIEPEDYVSIRIDFAGGDKTSKPNEWSKAYMYKMLPDSSWEYLGLGDVPFKAWDTENNKQLNVCTRDDGDMLWNMGWDGTKFPNNFGNNEWILIMKSNYDLDNTYNNIEKGPNEDAMYFLWPKRFSLNSVFLSNSFSMSLARNPINKPGDELFFTSPQPSKIPGYKGTPFVILDNNFPNPFNPTTTIHFDLGKDYRNISLTVYNILGQQVRVLKNEPMLLGSYIIRWDGKNENQNPVSSGIYFYRLVTDGFSQTKKMILLK